MRVRIIAEPVLATTVARVVRAARGQVAVQAELVPPPSGDDVVLLDLQVPGAWAWLSELSAKHAVPPVVVLVFHEATGLKALLTGAAGVLNAATMQAPEVVGLLTRVTDRVARQTALVQQADAHLAHVAYVAHAAYAQAETERTWGATLSVIEATLAQCAR